MANSQPQHCCVFVGNIPYDVKEEQIKEVLEIVGPVVSFRIVTDRETGKPKGYGFCEYKDEETALSARRNLQGYEINGRQLRVDSAANDKKQGEATTTAGKQTPSVANDPIAIHLGKLPRHHLIEVVSQIKALAMHNKEQARQLLLASSSLPRALLQALVLLELAPPPPASVTNQQAVPSPFPLQAPQPQFVAQSGNRNFPQGSFTFRPQMQQSGPVNVNQGPVVSDSIDPRTKLVRLNDGRAVPSSKPDSVPLPPQKQELPTDKVSTALLQQVLDLKPEQLRSLPPHQQQHIIQLQHMFRQTS